MGNIYCRDAHFCRQQEQMCGQRSPVTHETLRQQGGTGQDSHIHLADWTLSAAAIEKKKRTGRKSPKLLTHNGKARMNISLGQSENHQVTYIGQARLKIIIYHLDQVKITKLLTHSSRARLNIFTAWTKWKSPSYLLLTVVGPGWTYSPLGPSENKAQYRPQLPRPICLDKSGL